MESMLSSDLYQYIHPESMTMTMMMKIIMDIEKGILRSYNKDIMINNSNHLKKKIFSSTNIMDEVHIG